MPRNRDRPQDRNVNAQDANANIPHQDARVFAMHESLIQSYTHFTYYANHMYHLLSQSLHGMQNSINAQPYPWLQSPAPTQVPRPAPTQAQAPRPVRAHAQVPRQTQTQVPRQTQTQAPIQSQGALETSIINALFGLTHRPLLEPRLTQAQLNERVQHTAFRNIPNPINNVCSITHDVFEPDQQVARIRHCGHIFKPDGLAQWLRINNTCPTCRHNLLSSAQNAVPSNTNANASTTVSRDHEDTNININTLYNELLRNSANIPGFELNAVDDNSVVFSFDLMRRGETGPSH
jgi:hypothetical protein